MNLVKKLLLALAPLVMAATVLLPAPASAQTPDDEPAQDDLGAELTLGTSARFCVHSGGTIRRNRPRSFLAINDEGGDTCPFP